MSRSPPAKQVLPLKGENYPWSTLLPQEILREQLMKTDYDSLLTLCISEDPRFFSKATTPSPALQVMPPKGEGVPICNDSYFWDEKLQYELEARQLIPQEFYKLSAENGWAKFVAMLLTKYEIKDYFEIIPQAVENNQWLIIKFIANYIPDTIISAKKRASLKGMRISNLKNKSGMASIRERRRREYEKIIEDFEAESRIVFESAYLDAIKYDKPKIIEVLQPYIGNIILMRFFDNTTNEEIKSYIGTDLLRNLNNLSMHIYNRTLEKMEDLSQGESKELIKIIGVPKIIKFLSEYYKPEGVKLLEKILLNNIPKHKYYRILSNHTYDDEMTNLIEDLESRGKFKFVQAIKKSKFAMYLY